MDKLGKIRDFIDSTNAEEINGSEQLKLFTGSEFGGLNEDCTNTGDCTSGTNKGCTNQDVC